MNLLALNLLAHHFRIAHLHPALTYIQYASSTNRDQLVPLMCLATVTPLRVPPLVAVHYLQKQRVTSQQFVVSFIKIGLLYISE